MATISGWTLVAFGAITLLGTVFGDFIALALGAALAGLGANELRGASMLRRLDRRAPSILGWNQAALGVAIVAYAGWSLFSAINHPSLSSAGTTTGDPQIDRMVANLTTTVTYAFYLGVAAVGVVGPGLTALYYFTRAPYLRRALDDTPPWVIQTLRAAA